MGVQFLTNLNEVGKFPIISQAADYTAVSSDYCILVDTTGAARTITLPTAVGIAGKSYVVQRTTAGVNNVVVDGNGAETIDGAANKTLTTQFAAITVISDGTNWAMTTSRGTVT